MAKPLGGRGSPLKPDAHKLRAAYEKDLAAAWATARRAHARETPYAFVLYIVDTGELPHFMPVVMTDESLTRVAERYLDRGYHDTLDEARDALRYSIGDSPHLGELEQATPTLDAVVEPFAEAFCYKSGFVLLAKAAIAAVQKLDAQGLFGAGAERERLLLMIVIHGSPDDWSKKSVKALNPPAVFARFEAVTRVDGTFASCDALAIAADGQSLYSGGRRNHKDDDEDEIDALDPDDSEENEDGDGDHEEEEDEDVAHLVAYDLTERELARRWAFEFGTLGDSIRAVGCPPDGRSVVALRARYINNVCNTILLRFDRDSNVPIAEHQFTGEPAGFSLSADGSRVAVTLHNKTLHLFDAAFRPIRTWTFAQKVYRPLVLRSGEVLVSTHGGVLRIDPASDTPPAVAAELRSFQFATDAGETFLAVGRWFDLSGAARENPTPFGIHLLRLPTLERIRTIEFPNWQVVNPALSPDGRLLACVAHEVGKPRRFVVVVETTSGAEIARRKIRSVNVLQFLPDSRTLVIGVSETTPDEPIVLWQVV